MEPTEGLPKYEDCAGYDQSNSARRKGVSSLHGPGGNVWYQITCEYLFPQDVKKYHVVERKFQDQTWKFLYF